MVAKNLYEYSLEQNNLNASIKLCDFYLKGHGVKQDSSKAFESYEKSISLVNKAIWHDRGLLYEESILYNCLYKLGSLFYLYHHNPEKAICTFFFANNINYFKSGCKEKSNNFQLYNKKDEIFYGNKYLYGYDVPKDYLRAIKYYIISANIGNKKDFSKAKYYYEKSNNSKALVKLGDLYFYGYGVEQDYLKAKHYYELASIFYDRLSIEYNSKAFLKLGDIYYNGFGLQKNIIKALDYYAISAKYKNPVALFKLGEIYSIGCIVDINIKKSITYYDECIKCDTIFSLLKNLPDWNPKSSQFIIKPNKYNRIANNNLGLIHILFYNDIKNALKYIKEAAFAEYSFGQYNLGLLNLFFFE